MANTDHIVINFKTQAIECEHCGASTPLPLPMEVEALHRFGLAFTKVHKKCKVSDDLIKANGGCCND